MDIGSDSERSSGVSSLEDVGYDSFFQQQINESQPNQAWRKKRVDYLKFIVEQSGRSYTLSCCTFCSLFVLWIVLIITLGSSFLPFTTDMPLYIRDHPQKQRMDAVDAGKDVADADLPPVLPTLQRSQFSTAGGHALRMDLVYVSDFGSVFVEEILEAIQQLEAEIVSHDRYEEFCLLDWTEDERNYSNDMSLVAEERVSQVNEWNDAATTSPRRKELKLKQYSSINPFAFDTPEAVQHFYVDNADASFGGGNVASRAVRSTFYFGIPLAGYMSVLDRPGEQQEIIANFVWEFHHKLVGKSVPNAQVWFMGYEMQSKYLEYVLPRDGFLALGSMVFVLVYLAMMLRSWFLALMGIGQVVMCFAPAYFLYYGMFGQRYFGTFNILSIFIILGIGADDIFVLMDAWSQSKVHGPPVSDTKQSRFSYAWARAGKAMAVTSITTFVSFMANAASTFPAISTFGIFSASLVLVNYIAVVLYFPTVLSYYVDAWENLPFCFGIKKWFSFCRGDVKFHQVGPWGMGSAKKYFSFRDATDSDTSLNDSDADANIALAHTRSNAEVGPKLGVVESFFRDSYAPFVIRYKYPLFILFAAMTAIFTVVASTLATDPNPPQFFGAGDNYLEFWNALGEYFTRGGSVFAIEVFFVFGFQEDSPIDRTGTSATDVQSIGSPVWNDNFEVFVRNNETGVGAYDCVVQICDAAELMDGTRAAGGAPQFESDCWIRDYLEDVGRDQVDEWLLNGEEFALGTNLWNWFHEVSTRENDKINLDMYKQFFWAEVFNSGETVAERTYGFRLRFTLARVTLTAEKAIDFETGIELHNRWEEWMDDQLSTGACADPVVAESVKGSFQYAGDSWHTFFVQDVMISEARNGVLLSILLAFIVLTLANFNVIVALLCSITIFLIVLCVVGYIVMMNWKLGLLESINLVMVPGMAVDFVSHLASAYLSCDSPHREDRVRAMLIESGVSIISGAISTLGACAFLFFTTVLFFQKFGAFIFFTILASLVMSIGFFSTLMAIVGPQGDDGSFRPLIRSWWERWCKRKV